MIEIHATQDTDFIVSCVTHPRVWPHVSCDGVTPEQFKPPFDGLVFVEAINGNERLGVYMLRFINPVMVEIHTALLPAAWGEQSKVAAKALLSFLEGAGIRKAITMVPSDNRLAYMYAVKAGMKQEGVISKSYPKGGELLDQYVLGIELCQ